MARRAPRVFPWHSADKPVRTSRRSCQSGDSRSNRVLNHRAAALHGPSGTSGADVRGCPDPRHYLDAHAGKCRLLGSCRGQGQRWLWILPRAREAEVSENLLNHGGVVDRNDQLYPSGAAVPRREPDPRPTENGSCVSYALASGSSRCHHGAHLNTCSCEGEI